MKRKFTKFICSMLMFLFLVTICSMEADAAGVKFKVFNSEIINSTQKVTVRIPQAGTLYVRNGKKLVLKKSYTKADIVDITVPEQKSGTTLKFEYKNKKGKVIGVAKKKVKSITSRKYSKKVTMPTAYTYDLLPFQDTMYFNGKVDGRIIVKDGKGKTVGIGDLNRSFVSIKSKKGRVLYYYVEKGKYRSKIGTINVIPDEKLAKPSVKQKKQTLVIGGAKDSIVYLAIEDGEFERVGALVNGKITVSDLDIADGESYKVYLRNTNGVSSDWYEGTWSKVDFKYKINIINPYKYTLMNSLTIPVYIETNNPDPESFSVKINGETVFLQAEAYNFDDVKYEQVDDCLYYSDTFAKVEDGYIFCLNLNKSGRQEIQIYEHDNLAARKAISVKDYDKEYDKWLNTMIEKKRGKSSLETVNSCAAYVFHEFDYTAAIDYEDGTDKYANFVGNFGAFWERKEGTCWTSTRIVYDIATKLGLEASEEAPYGDHQNTIVKYKGKIYTIDATPLPTLIYENQVEKFNIKDILKGKVKASKYTLLDFKPGI